jgi:hypothetical protein
LLTTRVLVVGLGALAVVGFLVGCGDSGGGPTTVTVPASQLRAARERGEDAARERDKVAGLQRQVRAINRRLRHPHAHRPPPSASVVAEGGPTSATAAPAAPEGPSRSFHAPSGNVSCEVFSDSATCTVESVASTFVLEPGSPARVESGSALPTGLGELVEYGNTVSVGQIACEVPPSDVPRGISCVDQSDGHGFEASRLQSRQETY